MLTKASPPLTVVAASLAGIPIADWVQWLTFGYLIVMIGHKLWSWHREWGKGRAADGE